jgi:hypothetical protein
VLHYANTTRITCANFTIAQGEIVSGPSVASSVLVNPATSIIPTTIAAPLNGPAGWPTGVPYPPTAAPGWPAGYTLGGGGLGGWGAWGFGGGQATAVPAVAAVSGVAASVFGASPTNIAGVASSIASFVSSATVLPPIPGVVTGSIPHGTGFAPTAAAAVMKTSDGAVTEWSEYLLTVAGLFALTMVI